MNNKPIIALITIAAISAILIILKLTGLTDLDWYIVSVPALVLILCVLLYFAFLLIILKALDLKIFLNKRKEDAAE